MLIQNIIKPVILSTQYNFIKDLVLQNLICGYNKDGVNFPLVFK